MGLTEFPKSWSECMKHVNHKGKVLKDYKAGQKKKKTQVKALTCTGTNITLDSTFSLATMVLEDHEQQPQKSEHHVTK